jgi:hypothetical protein
MRNGDGTTWNMQKVEVAPVAAGKGRGRPKEGGEEDELKEMSKRAKQTAKVSGQKRGKKKGAAEDQDDPGGDTAMSSPSKSELHEASTGRRAESQADSSFIGTGTPPAGNGAASQQSAASGATSPPTKRNRAARPRKSAAPLTTPRQTSPEIVTIPSSDPPIPTSPEVRVIGANILKASHPFFSRTNSTSSKGAADDPIDIDEAPKKAGPKKLVFAADTKPAHPLFARPVTVNGNSQAHNAGPGSIPEETALSDHEPGPAKSTKVHAFFNGSGGGAIPGRIKNGWGRGIKEGEEPRAVWPGGAFPNHVTTEPTPKTEVAQVPRRAKVLPAVESNPSPFWSSVLEKASEKTGSSGSGQVRPYQHTTEPMSRPPYIADHPAISSVKRRKVDSNRETWAERYRPTAANQVLGNEAEASYLRDWLRVLSVGASDGTPRKVVRKVKKGKGQLVEGWIVDDAGIFGDAVDKFNEEEEGLEYVEYEEPDLALGQRPSAYPELATAQLTNTLLLVGPSGTGKSAAVHAAAIELGWGIFEVYPGMGKRTGGNMMSWVGDVGKNHLVVKGGRAETIQTPKDGIGSYFGGAVKRNREADDPIAISGSQGSMKDPIEIEESPREEKELELDVAETSTAVRQSLILIDEADILFAEENTFWPAVISLIAESRRPVIITCNGRLKVPC